MTPTTPTGRRLFPGRNVAQVFASVTIVDVLAIEDEAREGYVPAALGPEWHAELELTRAEERERIAQRVRTLDTGNSFAFVSGDEVIELVEKAAVLAILEGETG